jgi:hypothetical protein
MRFEHKLTFQDYLQAGDETAAVLLDAESPYRRAVNNAYDYFVGSLLVGDANLRPIPGFLAVNAFMLWMSSVRMAATGHAVATYPLFRVALESACYALLTQHDERKEEIWRDRDQDETTRKRCREALTGALKEAAKYLNEKQQGSGDAVLQSYELAIDYGAHPNSKSIFRNVRVQEDTDTDFWHVHLATIDGPESSRARQALVASLEYATVIGTVLLRTLPNVTQAQADALGALHNEKENLVTLWS